MTPEELARIRRDLDCDLEERMGRRTYTLQPREPEPQQTTAQRRRRALPP